MNQWLDLIWNFEIENFKSLRHVSISVKPITILIGLNSSGKSSVIQYLEILKQTTKTNSNLLVTDRELINLGKFEDIVSHTAERKEISFTMGGDRIQWLHHPFGMHTEYDYSFTVDSKGLKCHDCSMISGEIRLQGRFNKGRNRPKVRISLGENTMDFIAEGDIGHPMRLFESISSSQNFDFEEIETFLNVIKQELNDFFLIPAMRGISSPSYPLDAKASEDIMDSNNLNQQAIKFASTVVYKSPEIEKKINKWLSKITGITIRARTIPDKQAAVEASRGRNESNIINEGFGSNQLVYMFTQIATAPECSLIGIEEPEVHLHPRAQSALSKVLLEIARDEGKNLIITTHSEHVLYGILTEIAKGKLKTDEVAIYHFALSRDGITRVEKLKIDEKGRLEKGIPDFFETDLNEFKDFLEAMKP